MISGFSKYNIGEYKPYMYDIFEDVNNALWDKLETKEITFMDLRNIRWNMVFERIGYKFREGRIHHPVPRPDRSVANGDRRADPVAFGGRVRHRNGDRASRKRRTDRVRKGLSGKADRIRHNDFGSVLVSKDAFFICKLVENFRESRTFVGRFPLTANRKIGILYL